MHDDARGRVVPRNPRKVPAPRMRLALGSLRDEFWHLSDNTGYTWTSREGPDDLIPAGISLFPHSLSLSRLSRARRPPAPLASHSSGPTLAYNIVSTGTEGTELRTHTTSVCTVVTQK